MLNSIQEKEKLSKKIKELDETSFSALKTGEQEKDQIIQALKSKYENEIASANAKIEELTAEKEKFRELSRKLEQEMIEKEKDIEDFFKDDFERTKKEWETQVW